MSSYKETLLKNGLRLITSTYKSNSTAIVSLWVKAGSRYEKTDQLGYTHFLEHLLCKKINNLYNEAGRKQIGAYTNAFTGKENTRFIIETPAKYTSDSIKVLSELIKDIEISPDDFEINKKIILEEALTNENKPLRKFNRLISNIFFNNHPLSQSPIGSMDVIKNSTVEQLREYQHNYFIPEKSAVIVVSNLEHEEILKEVEQNFLLWTSNQNKEITSTPLVSNHEAYLYIPSNTEQTQIILSFHSPGALNPEEEASLVIIRNYLGLGINSFLAEKLRHETGLVYIVSTHNIRHTDAGIFQIQTASSDPIKTVQILFNSINDFIQNLTPQEITEIKERMYNSFERFYSNPKNELGFLGEGFILFGKLFKPEDYKKMIEQNTFENIIDTTKKYLKKDNSLLALMGPTNIKDSVN